MKTEITRESEVDQMKMRVKDLKKLLEYVDDNTEVVVGCEGYCNYNFSNKEYYDGENGIIKLTKVEDVLVIHPRNDDPHYYR